MKNTRRVRVCDMEETFFRAPSRKRSAPYLLRFAQTAPLGRESSGPDGKNKVLPKSRTNSFDPWRQHAVGVFACGDVTVVFIR